MVRQAWPHVRPLLARVFARGVGDATLASMEVDLLAGSQLLWIVWDGRAVIAAATTEIRSAPAGTVCVITSCAGTGLPAWRGYIAKLEDYARGQGCARMRVEGRRGWKRVLPDYSEPWITLEKELS